MIIIILYGLYIFTMNLMSLETNGKIIGTNYVSETYYTQTGRLFNYIARKGLWQSHTTTYKYEVNNRTYESTQFSNVLIYPNIMQDENNVTVYYNRYINKYSLLYKCNLKYFLINLIPFYILTIITLYYKKRYIKNIKILDLIKNYFKIGRSIYKKYNFVY
jgi:hypothetical protein